MSGRDQILIVGSLPPTPSGAALLTHMLATELREKGVETTVLIDEMSVPPQAASYQVVRPFDPEVQDGKFDTWPRLYVLGNKPDSLPVVDQMQTAPGAAIVADTSLFDLALRWLDLKPDGDKDLNTWLTDQHGVSGTKLAEAIIHHRRRSKAVGQEISGYDLLLSQATSLVPVSLGQKAEFERQDLPCQSRPLLPFIVSEAPTVDNTDSDFLIVGLSKIGRTFLETELAHHKNIRCRFLSRFSEQTTEAVMTSGCLVVLDGDDAAFCPLVAAAASADKPIICANQPWLADLSPGSVLPVSHADAYRELIHAMLHVRTTQLGGKQNQQSIADKAESLETLLQAAKTSTVLERLSGPKFADVSTQELPQIEAAPPGTSAARALVGAVPASHILASQMPGIELDSSPRFLTPALANYLSELVEEPVLRLSDYLGFENPIVDADESHLPVGAEKKRMLWEDIAKGLHAADAPIAFGCAFDEALSPAKPIDNSPVQWAFKLPPAVLEKRGPTKEYDWKTNIFWKYDTSRSHVIILLMTGSAGALSISTRCEEAFLVSDGRNTQHITGKNETSCHIDTSGVACLKFAAIPDENGNVPDIRSMLCTHQLTLTWKRL